MPSNPLPRLAAATAVAALLATACGSSTSPSTSTSAAVAPSTTAGATSSSTTAGTASTAASASTAAAGTSSAATTAAGSVASSASTTSAAMLTATKTFLALLSADQQSTVVAERTAANLGNWSNLPDALFKRSGIRMDKLSADQQKAVLAILAAGLSPEGYAQVTQITAGDGVLAASGGNNLDFGADHYWIRFVGTPAADGVWTVQYGGHHLAVNITVTPTGLTLAPTLWGAQPASYTSGADAVEPLSGETTKAFAVIDALDATQQKAAILTTATKEIVLGAGKDGQTVAAEGVKVSTFTDAQKALLLALVDEWLTPLNTTDAAAKLATAQAELDQMTFAWYGATTIGQPIYYRVQSPSFVIEFAHQQGQGANAGGITHIHSIYREIGNDYGAASVK